MNPYESPAEPRDGELSDAYAEFGRPEPKPRPIAEFFATLVVAILIVWVCTAITDWLFQWP